MSRVKIRIDRKTEDNVAAALESAYRQGYEAATKDATDTINIATDTINTLEVRISELKRHIHMLSYGRYGLDKRRIEIHPDGSASANTGTGSRSGLSMYAQAMRARRPAITHTIRDMDLQALETMLYGTGVRGEPQRSEEQEDGDT